MKIVFGIISLITLTCCHQPETLVPKADRFYILYRSDTHFVDKPSFDTSKLKTVIVKNLSDFDNFRGKVYKLTNSPAPVDGERLYYFTPDLGIIYSKNTTWKEYYRLHSTNDSIEKRINDYLGHILADRDLLLAGETIVTLIPELTRKKQNK